MPFDSIDAIVEDLRQGRMIVMLDDEDRENEGDIVMAAEKVQPQDVNFMIRHARGLLCLPLTETRAASLGLRLMVDANQSPYHTNFTVSIEAASGVSTGISAADRARTIQAAVAAGARAEDLVQPGHIFPLIAKAGGVLQRAGHTEASCDLVAMAGLEPAAALIEILRDDGEMARRPELEIFARSHGLKIGSIADLIQYRLDHEVLVDLHDHDTVSLPAGVFQRQIYRDRIEGRLHELLWLGDDPMSAADQGLIVLESEAQPPGLSAALAQALHTIHSAGRGAVVRVTVADQAAAGRGAWDRRRLGQQILLQAAAVAANPSAASSRAAAC